MGPRARTRLDGARALTVQWSAERPLGTVAEPTAARCGELNVQQSRYSERVAVLRLTGRPLAPVLVALERAVPSARSELSDADPVVAQIREHRSPVEPFAARRRPGGFD